MNVRGMFIYFYFIIFLVSTGCTKLSPQLNFEFLKTSDDSLTIESNIETINSNNANATIHIKGVCESNTNLNVTNPANSTIEFKCETFSYEKQFSATLLAEGDNYFSVDAFDNSKNLIASKKLKIIKDTIVPSLTISGPTSVTSGETLVPISGLCSEADMPVLVQDVTSGTNGNAPCINGGWNYSASVPNDPSVLSMQYEAQHLDKAGNKITSNSIAVNRYTAPVFSITGVRNQNSEVPGNFLKKITGTLLIDWSATVPAHSYDVSIERNYLSNPSIVCSQTGVLILNLSLSLPGSCALNQGENLRVKIVGWDSSHTSSRTEHFLFSTKSAPDLKNDAKILYVNSDSENTIPSTNIPFSDLVYDPHSNGPFTITVSDPGDLSSMITVDNLSSIRSISITPTLAVSGIYPVKIKIADENSLTSDEITLKVAIVFPYSWSGLTSNDFADKSNWCGVAGLKTGCTGVPSSPSSTSRIFINNLCETPAPGAQTIRCRSRLSADTNVRSLSLKYGVFEQADKIFTVGTLSDNGSYFDMTGGVFNDGIMGGNLTVYKSFHVEGGLFNAPKNSDLTLNTNKSDNSSDAFKVLNNTFYTTNNSTLILSDPTGQAFSQNISVPSGFTLKNLTINSNGGRWGIKSTNLILTGDLNLNGTKDSSNNYPLLNSSVSGGKINLAGNLNCGGAFGGGNLPIYISGASSKYQTTFAGCKLPQIKITESGANFYEATGSSEDTTLQSLSVTGGSFTAPSSPRKLIFKSTYLDDNSVIADLSSSGFNHNNGIIVFETASNSLNFKLNLPNLYDVIFTNPNNLSSFYDIQNNFTGYSFSLKGSHSVPVRGFNRTVSVNQINFDTGFVIDANQLTKLVQQTDSISYIGVNTGSPINIPKLEMKNAQGFLGTSLLLNFSGTTMVLSTNDIYIGFSQVFKYYTKTGSGNVTGVGVYGSGY